MGTLERSSASSRSTYASRTCCRRQVHLSATVLRIQPRTAPTKMVIRSGKSVLHPYPVQAVLRCTKRSRLPRRRPQQPRDRHTQRSYSKAPRGCLTTTTEAAPKAATEREPVLASAPNVPRPSRTCHPGETWGGGGGPLMAAGYQRMVSTAPASAERSQMMSTCTVRTALTLDAEQHGPLLRQQRLRLHLQGWRSQCRPAMASASPPPGAGL